MSLDDISLLPCLIKNILLCNQHDPEFLYSKNILNELTGFYEN
jgi:hypothetical protein